MGILCSELCINLCETYNTVTSAPLYVPYQSGLVEPHRELATFSLSKVAKSYWGWFVTKGRLSWKKNALIGPSLWS